MFMSFAHRSAKKAIKRNTEWYIQMDPDPKSEIPGKKEGKLIVPIHAGEDIEPEDLKKLKTIY